MNLGDGLLFELEDGKPKLTLLNAGVEKNTRKLSCRPRAGNILSTRQPTCVEKLQGEEFSGPPLSRRDREMKSRRGGMAASTTSARKGISLTLTKPQEQARGGCDRIITNGHSDRHDHSDPHGFHRASQKTDQVQKSGPVAGAKIALRDPVELKDYIMKNSVADLTAEQLQHILNIVETTYNGQGPSEDHKTRGNETHSRCVSPVSDGEGAERMFEHDGEGGLLEGSDATITSPSENKGTSGGLFSWLDGRPSASRVAINSKKAQWKRELDEQVAQKQLGLWSAPHKQQAEEERVLLVCKEQPAALRSNLRLGAITPIEEVLSVRRREEQRRRWLEELDKQREETSERRRREKHLQSQPEDHQLWASHFDSLQRKPPVPAAAPTPAPLEGLEQREWEPTSRLSLLSEAASTCGGESGRGVVVETTCGHSTRTSYLRTMTALLDPAQLEERDRRRMKQLELQRAIEAQVEEKRRQREQEKAMKRKEEEEEERRLSLERKMLENRHKMDILKEKQAHRSQQDVQPSEGGSQEVEQRAPEPEGELCSCRISVCRDGDGLEEVTSSARTYRDTAVQTEAAVCPPLPADRADTPGDSAQHQRPAPPPNRKNQAGKRGKENICLQGEGADLYQAFARTEQRKEPRRAEWNTHRPGQQFVPASERYAASVQKNRQERRLKRQAELLALQGGSRLSRTSTAAPQQPQLGSAITQGRTGSTRKVSRGYSSTADVHVIRRRSPAIPARAEMQQDLASPTPPLPGLDFIPYVRTQEVLNLDPLEPDNVPPPRSQAEAIPAPSHHEPPLLPELIHDTHKLQETLRGLAQLRRGLLQKQRELERDLSPVLRHYENKPR